MHVIRFVMPSKNKTLKKLLLLFYEVTPKKNPDGKLKQEFILIWYKDKKNNLFSEFHADSLAKLQQCSPQRPAAPQRVHPRMCTALPVQAA